MNKKYIKNELRVLSEDKKPKGLKTTEKTQKDSEKENKAYQKEYDAKMKEYVEAPDATKEDNSEVIKKRELSDDEQDISDQFEKLNGLEMVKYDLSPDELFQKRAKEAIVGSNEMGNNPEWANVVTSDQAGFTGPEFGSKIVKHVEYRMEKESETVQYTGMGDVAIPRGKNKKNKPTAISESKKKRLTFKKPFNGINGALKLIPESYKVDGKEFQMTDGDESYEIVWRGSLNEGSALITKTKIKGNLLNENLDHMKHLMNFKKEEEVLSENDSFRNEMRKYNKLLKKKK